VTELRLGEVAAQIEAERFVGRRGVLDLVDTVMAGTSTARIVLLHGPGGVGKSALLRAIARKAHVAGLPVLQLDGRMVPPIRDALDLALAPATEHAVVLIDEADELAPLRFELRRAILETLPASAMVVIAGRRAPGKEWFEGGLAAMVTSVAVRPLANDESTELLLRYGIHTQEEVTELVAWAKGYPLALTLAASLPAPADDGARVVPDINPSGPEATLDDVLLSRLGGNELAGVDPDVLDVASIAPAVDARMLAAVLPGHATREGIAQLRSLSITEPVGTRTTLHRLARVALRARLRQTDPDRYRALVLRIARHLRDRGLVESPLVALEMSELVENPELRVGFDTSTTHYTELPRAGDLSVAAEFTGAGNTAWFARFSRWCTEQPEQSIVVRRANGDLSAIAIICMAWEMPSWAWDDIETGPILRRAEANGVLHQTGLIHDTIILESDPVAVAEVMRVGNAGVIAMGAIRNPRYIYVTNPHQRSNAGSEPLGYRDVPELRRCDRERELVTMMTDFGPDGLVGQIYGLILSEQHAEAPKVSGAKGLAIIDALRSFHDDAALGASPLAEGAGPDRARWAVRTALDVAFGSGDTDQRLRMSIERTYLDADGGHGIAQREMHMSRSSFYRHLQRAREQLAASAVEISAS